MSNQIKNQIRRKTKQITFILSLLDNTITLENTRLVLTHNDFVEDPLNYFVYSLYGFFEGRLHYIKKDDIFCILLLDPELPIPYKLKGVSTDSLNYSINEILKVCFYKSTLPFSSKEVICKMKKDDLWDAWK